jgi:WD40 repeat protein
MMIHTNSGWLFGTLAASMLICTALSSSGCSDKQAAQGSREDTVVSSASALLVTVLQDDRPPAKDAASANQLPKGAIQDFFFSETGRSVAYSVRDYGYSYVSVNGKPGKVYKADVSPVVMSPGGSHVAYAAPVGGSWRMVVDGVEGAEYTQVKEPKFSPDGRHVAYTALKEGRWGLVVDNEWHDGQSPQMQEFHLFSGDSTRIAYVDQVKEHYAGRLVVADLRLKEQKVLFPTGAGNLIGNADGTRGAVIVLSEGKQKVATFSFANPAELKTGPGYDRVNNLVFGPDGTSLAYTAEKGGVTFVVYGDREEPAGVGEFRESPVVRPDLKGVGVIAADKDDRPYLREYFSGTGNQPKRYDGASFLTYSKDGVAAYAAASLGKKAWFVVVGGKEGPAFDRVVMPHFSPDGKFVVYRARKDGKRFVVVADRSGKTVRQHPSHEQVFELRFTADGRSVAYGVKDAQKLSWTVEPL